MKSWVRAASSKARDMEANGQNLFSLSRSHYSIDWSLISDSSIQRLFVELDSDEETQNFIKECVETTGFGQWISNVGFYVMSLFHSVTDANGMLQRGEMFVFSPNQLVALLSKAKMDFKEADRPVLLDVGAGDGNVTRNYEILTDKIFTTEVSLPMVNRLNERGYNCIQTTDLHSSLFSHKFDIISCLNVLDRCDKPKTLLSQMKSLLSPNGIIILAIVLPFSAFVETGTAQRPPQERLDMDGGSCCDASTGICRPIPFEASLEVFISNVLRPNGLEIASFSRLPYLSKGDLHQDYYTLADAIFVLRNQCNN